MNKPLGKIGEIVWQFNGKEHTTHVERSTGRNLGFKTDKALLKNIKLSVENLQRQQKPIISVSVLTVAMLATDVQLLRLKDL